MLDQFREHVIGMRNDGVVTMQVLLPPSLETVELEHGDGTQATTAVRKIMRETLPTKATATRLDHGKPEGLGSADTGAVIVMGEENGRRDPEHATLNIRISELVRIDHIGTPATETSQSRCAPTPATHHAGASGGSSPWRVDRWSTSTRRDPGRREPARNDGVEICFDTTNPTRAPIDYCDTHESPES